MYSDNELRGSLQKPRLGHWCIGSTVGSNPIRQGSTPWWPALVGGSNPLKCDGPRPRTLTIKYFGLWENLVNPPALGAGDFRFKSELADKGRYNPF